MPISTRHRPRNADHHGGEQDQVREVQDHGHVDHHGEPARRAGITPTIRRTTAIRDTSTSAAAIGSPHEPDIPARQRRSQELRAWRPAPLGINIGYLPIPASGRSRRAMRGYSYSYVQVDLDRGDHRPDLHRGQRRGYRPAPVHDAQHRAPGWCRTRRSASTPRFAVRERGTGDFDNDMHEDIFMACTGGAHNIANRLFWNNGNGNFTEVANAGGAGGHHRCRRGRTRRHRRKRGTADYDLDGFLDLLVVNGLNMRPVYMGGPKQLFHNLGAMPTLDGIRPGWHHLQPRRHRLEGLRDRRRVTQYREQNGGYHRWSQNFIRVHVGLAGNTQADTTVVWPDGNSTTYTGPGRQPHLSAQAGWHQRQIHSNEVGPGGELVKPVAGRVD